MTLPQQADCRSLIGSLLWNLGPGASLRLRYQAFACPILISPTSFVSIKNISQSLLWLNSLNLYSLQKRNLKVNQLLGEKTKINFPQMLANLWNSVPRRQWRQSLCSFKTEMDILLHVKGINRFEHWSETWRVDLSWSWWLVVQPRLVQMA